MHRLLILSASALVLFAARPSRAELVTNGGFETGSLSGWSTDGAGGVEAIGPIVGVYSEDYYPHAGGYMARFSRIEPGDQLFQTLSTVSGQQYTLSFWLDNAVNGDDSFKVLWEGSNVLNLTPIDSPDDGWKQYTLSLTASTSGSELRFIVFDDPFFNNLDDVSVVVAVPEPATLSFFVIGVFALLKHRRFRAQPSCGR